MAEIIFLGTSGYVPAPERDNASFVLKTEEGPILVDCPGGPFRKLAAAGIDAINVRSIFITHVHADHVYGLPSLIHGLMLHEHTFKLYGSAESVAFCRRLLGLFGLRASKYKTRVEFEPLVPGERVPIAEGVEVTAWNVLHHSSSLAFEFQIMPDGKRVVFSGDTAVHAPLFEWARSADVLVHDCGAPERFFEMYPALRAVHTSAADLGLWSARAGIRLLAPVHFLSEIAFDPIEVRAEIRKNFTGQLFMPADMDRLAVK